MGGGGGLLSGAMDFIGGGLGTVAKLVGKAVSPGNGPGAPPPPPVAPTMDNSVSSVDDALAASANAAKRGRGSTILTGALGVTSDAPTASAKLLGNA
jgi:hypothetical protein